MAKKSNTNPEQGSLGALFSDEDLLEQEVTDEGEVEGPLEDTTSEQGGGVREDVDDVSEDLDAFEDESETGGEASDREDEAIDNTEASEDESASLKHPETIASIMEGNLEEEGALTLARYASRAYLEYAMSVVKSRALPEVSDGQKPVQRRILIDMDRMGLKAGNKVVKSARVVGDVLGKYHPHGDQSVYDAMVRMAQDFSMRYPLVDGKGNFGSRDGDSQAAMRYTEARLMPIAELLLEEVDTGAVDFVPNYDGNFQEPVALPAKLPFVLLNGASGIAVGMATEIPSHNLREVAAACEYLIDHPEATLDEILALMPAPDFPCGAQIISNAATLRDVYRTGRGKIRVRARYHFEELARGQWQLVVDELPPDTSTAAILNQIESITNPKLRAKKKTLTAQQQQAKTAMLALLDRARDESGSGTPVRLVFEPKTRTTDRDELVRALLSQTSLESNVSVNMVMIGIDGKPQQKSLLAILQEWVAFRTEVVRRRSQASLEKVLDRMHVLEGRTIALLNLDRVIQIIREEDEPKAVLMAEFQLTDRQAEDILEIRLRQLAKLAAIAIERELAELEREKNGLERLLSSDNVLRRALVKEINAAAQQYGDDRRTLVKEAETVVNEQKVLDEPVTVVISKKGFIQVRKGHGHDCSLMSFKVGDELDVALECRSVDDVHFISTEGRVYSIKVSALPNGRGEGLPINAFIEVDRASSDFAGIIVGADEDRLLMGTTDGYGLTCRIKDIRSTQRLGKAFVKVNEGAKLLAPMRFDDQKNHCACLSAEGRLLVYPIEELRELPNGGMGVSLMKLEAGESLLAVTPVSLEGLILQGTGRGGKARELKISEKSLADFVMHRARKGRFVGLSFKVTRMLALADTQPSTDSSLVIDIEDQNPKLL